MERNRPAPRPEQASRTDNAALGRGRFDADCIRMRAHAFLHMLVLRDKPYCSPGLVPVTDLRPGPAGTEPPRNLHSGGHDPVTPGSSISAFPDPCQQLFCRPRTEIGLTTEVTEDTERVGNRVRSVPSAFSVRSVVQHRVQGCRQHGLRTGRRSRRCAAKTHCLLPHAKSEGGLQAALALTPNC